MSPCHNNCPFTHSFFFFFLLFPRTIDRSGTDKYHTTQPQQIKEYLANPDAYAAAAAPTAAADSGAGGAAAAAAAAEPEEESDEDMVSADLTPHPPIRKSHSRFPSPRRFLAAPWVGFRGWNPFFRNPKAPNGRKTFTDEARCNFPPSFSMGHTGTLILDFDFDSPHRVSISSADLEPSLSVLLYLYPCSPWKGQKLYTLLRAPPTRLHGMCHATLVITRSMSYITKCDQIAGCTLLGVRMSFQISMRTVTELNDLV